MNKKSFFALLCFVILFLAGCTRNQCGGTLADCESAEGCIHQPKGDIQVRDVETVGLWANKATEECRDGLQGAVFGGEVGEWTCVNENEDGELMVLVSITNAITCEDEAGWLNCKEVEFLTPDFDELSALEKQCAEAGNSE